MLRIRHRLDIFNQIVLYIQSQFDKTFNNPNPADLAALNANLEKGYRDAAKQAEIVTLAISDLEKSLL